MGTYWQDERNRGRSDGALGSASSSRRSERDRDPAGAAALAPVIRALSAEPTDRELDGMGPALAAFRARVRQQATGSRRHRVFATLLGAKVGATLAGVAAGLVGVSTVVLVSTHVPGGAQPPGGPAAPAQARPAAVSTTATPHGPDANGPAKHGLCTAWRARSQNPGAQGHADQSVAFTNLVKAAGGANKVAAFCADVLAPGAAGNQGGGKGSGKPTGKGSGKPTKQPGHQAKDDDKATGKPGDVPNGQRTDTPTDEPTDEPTSTPTTEPTDEPTTTSTAEPTDEPTTTAIPTAPTGTPVPQTSGTVEPSQTVVP